MVLCSVTTFVCATEDTSKGCQLTPAKPPVAEPVLYEKGVRNPGYSFFPLVLSTA